MTPGSSTDLKAKAGGDKSMLEKREDTRKACSVSSCKTRAIG